MPTIFNAKLPIAAQLEPPKEGGSKWEMWLNGNSAAPLPDRPSVFVKVVEVPFGRVTVVGTDRALTLKTASAIEIDEPTDFTAPRRFKIREVYPADGDAKLTIVIVQTGI